MPKAPAWPFKSMARTGDKASPCIFNLSLLDYDHWSRFAQQTATEELEI